ncbi:MAG: hypothetical protein CMJ31_05180 [Phycisphaerae bacterium]|nr:hypothetical protein [Phycisphaerae bacterium]
MHARTARHRAFSLIELVVVVVILGVIAAIAIPRMSRGAAGAGDSGVASDLAILRNAIELYRAEHDGDYPPVATFEAALTQFSDRAGNTQATPDTTHIYGPYITAIPALKVGAKRGATGVANADAAGIGWIYDDASGDIRANATESDDAGVAYNTY